MARRRQIPAKQHQGLFGFGRRRQTRAGPSNAKHLKAVALILGVVLLLGGAGVGIYHVEQYVLSQDEAKTGPLVLVGVPEWVNDELRDRVFKAAGGREFEIGEKTAAFVATNLQGLSWLDQVQVLVTNRDVRVLGKWRRPIALVRTGSNEFFVDPEQMVLDFVPMDHMHIIVIKGVPIGARPAPGTKLARDDLAAALKVLGYLDRMDRELVPDDPLLDEIESIDVSNFRGRESDHDSHIVLWTRANTQVLWGTEIGAWHKYLEASDDQKVAKLYTYYRQQGGTLLGEANYITLRDPDDTIPQPIDRYR